jgi:hypothetical protein
MMNHREFITKNKGVAALFDIARRAIVCVKLNRIDNETLVLRQYLVHHVDRQYVHHVDRQYVHHVDTLCQVTVTRNWTGCAYFNNSPMESMNQLTRTESLVKEITVQRTGGKMKKRGVFTFIGELSETLFGTVDEDDAKHHNEPI